MKKLLTILAAFGLSATAGLTVVSCSNDKNNDTNETDKDPEYTNQGYQAANDFLTAYTTWKNLNNSYVQGFVGKQLTFYKDSQQIEDVKQNYNSFDQTEIGKLVIADVQSNFKMFGLLSMDYDWTKDSQPINLTDTELTDNTDYLSFKSQFEYTNDDGQVLTVPVSGKIHLDKNTNGVIKEVDGALTSNEATIQYAIDNYSKVSDPNGFNYKGYFMGLDFVGQKAEDQSWIGEQTVDLAKQYDVASLYMVRMLQDFNIFDSSVKEIPTDTMNGWNINDPTALYIAHKEELQITNTKVILQADQDFLNHSIVSKTFVTIDGLEIAFSGSYLQINQYLNY